MRTGYACDTAPRIDNYSYVCMGEVTVADLLRMKWETDRCNEQRYRDIVDSGNDPAYFKPYNCETWSFYHWMVNNGLVEG
jgi:hypothetical protein